MINYEILNTEMKKILIISLLLSLIALQCKAIDNIKELTTTGEGESIEQATIDALRRAIEEAVGIQVYSELGLIDYDITLDEIKAVTFGVIQEHQIISSNMNEEGFYVVTVHSLVSTIQHISDGKERGTRCNFNGQSFKEKFLYALIQKQHQLKEERRELIDLVIREAKRENVEKNKLENYITQENATIQSTQMVWESLLSQFKQDDYAELTLEIGEPQRTNNNDIIAFPYKITPHTTQAFGEYCNLIYYLLDELQLPNGPHILVGGPGIKLSYKDPFPAERLNKLLTETFSREIYIEDNLGNRYGFEHINFNPNDYKGFPWFRYDTYSKCWGFEEKYETFVMKKKVDGKIKRFYYDNYIPFEPIEGQLLIPYKIVDKINSFTAGFYNNHQIHHIYHNADDEIKDTINTYMGEKICYHIKIPIDSQYMDYIDKVTATPGGIEMFLMQDDNILSVNPVEYRFVESQLSHIDKDTKGFNNLELVLTIPSLRIPAAKKISMLIDLQYTILTSGTDGYISYISEITHPMQVELLLYSPIASQLNDK